MFKLANLQQIITLPITSTLKEQILSILTEPFYDEVKTQQTWDEVQYELKDEYNIARYRAYPECRRGQACRLSTNLIGFRGLPRLELRANRL